jgi:calcineurin-like phosphoesterase
VGRVSIQTVSLQLNELDRRVTSLEESNEQAKKERQTVLNILNGTPDQQGLVQKTDRIMVWVEGTDHIFGFCRKHWRTLFKFGAGVVTAYGVSNPHVQNALNYILKFSGI